MLIAADFDGTLAPIASSPAAAQMSPGARQVLAGLAAHPDVTLAVLSGRGLRDLGRKVSLPVILAGNHGLEIGGPGAVLCPPPGAVAETATRRDLRRHRTRARAVAGGVARGQVSERDGPFSQCRSCLAT